MSLKALIRALYGPQGPYKALKAPRALSKPSKLVLKMSLGAGCEIALAQKEGDHNLKGGYEGLA